MDQTFRRPDRLMRHEPRPYLSMILFILPLISAVLLWLALGNLGLTGGGFAGFLKTLLLPFAAFIVSYAIYRLAIEKGATLLSVGFLSAGVVGVGSIVVVGAGLYVGTLPGLIIKQVEERRLQVYATDMARYADRRAAQAAEAGRAVPVITAIAVDLDAKATCEKENSCVSLRKSGGYGDTARTLETLAGRASSVRDEAMSGFERHEAARAALASDMQRIEVLLADEGRDIWDRRTALRALDVGLEQTLIRLDEAVPIALLGAYAEELRTGVTLPGRPEIAASIDALLKSYAGNLDAALSKAKTEAISRPVFPPRTGAIQTFAYIGEFAPIALLTFAVELVFPLTLWAYTVMSLSWERYRQNPEADRPSQRESFFDDLTDIRVVRVPPRPASQSSISLDRAPDTVETAPAPPPPRRGRPRSS